jgi:putative acetyltransferase
MLVRRELPSDAADIRQVLCAGFPTDAEARLVDLLRVAGRLTVSLVAEVDGCIAGYVAFSSVTVASGSVGIGLAPLAVLQAYQRQGIASSLVTAGLAACRELGFGWGVVLGDPAYYSRFGFRSAADFGLVDAFGGGPAFQVIELMPGKIPRNEGLVRYAPEFDMFA